MLAYTGGVVNDWQIPIVWDMAGMSTPVPMPILRQHDHNKIAALATESTRVPQGVQLKGKMYNTPAAQEICELGDQGFPWQASIGVENLEVDLLEPGETRQLNDTTHTGPMVIVTKSLVKESSFVPLGADGQTRSSVLADGGTITMKEKVKMTDVKTGPDLVQLERERVKGLKLAFPKDPQYALEHIELGTSVLEAKAAYADVLQKKLDEKPTVTPPADVPARGRTAPEGSVLSAKKEFENKLREYVKLHGNKGMALAALVKDEPDLQQRMLTEVNGRPMPTYGRGS